MNETPATRNLRAEEAMTLAEERAERAWEMLDKHPQQRERQKMGAEMYARRFARLAQWSRRGGSYATGSGMITGAEGPILPSEAQLCHIVAREWMNSCEAMYRFVEAQKGGVA